MVFGKGRQHSETDKECKKGRKKIQRELFNQLHSEKGSTLGGGVGKREGQAKQEDNELLNHGQTKIRLWKTAPCDVTKSIETSPMSVSSNPEAVVSSSLWDGFTAASSLSLFQNRGRSRGAFQHKAKVQTVS